MAEKDNRYIGNPFYYAYDRTHGITWNLFGECNFRCSYCIVPDDLSDSSAKAMHPEFSFDKLMGFYEENFSGSTNIHFIEASGEPTIHEHFKRSYYICCTIKILIGFSLTPTYQPHFGKKLMKIFPS